MKSQIDTLKRDIQIHKEVEKELAKRSHFCQKVIKRVKQQVKDMETDKMENPNRGAVASMGGGGTARRSQNNMRKSMDFNSPSNRANEDLINFLE